LLAGGDEAHNTRTHAHARTNTQRLTRDSRLCESSCAAWSDESHDRQCHSALAHVSFNPICICVAVFAWARCRQVMYMYYRTVFQKINTEMKILGRQAVCLGEGVREIHRSGRRDQAQRSACVGSLLRYSHFTPAYVTLWPAQRACPTGVAAHLRREMTRSTPRPRDASSYLPRHGDPPPPHTHAFTPTVL
jgi:tRNA(Arg) A34 adenosine deaminase TadA